jgi:hypothetical protein
MSVDDSLMPWAWWIPAAGSLASHRGATAHRGPTATRAANHIKDYMKVLLSTGACGRELLMFSIKYSPMDLCRQLLPWTALEGGRSHNCCLAYSYAVYLEVYA